MTFLVTATLVLFVADGITARAAEESAERGALASVAGLVSDDRARSGSQKGPGASVVFSVRIIITAARSPESKCGDRGGKDEKFLNIR